MTPNPHTFRSILSISSTILRSIWTCLSKEASTALLSTDHILSAFLQFLPSLWRSMTMSQNTPFLTSPQWWHRLTIFTHFSFIFFLKKQPYKVQGSKRTAAFLKLASVQAQWKFALSQSKVWTKVSMLPTQPTSFWCNPPQNRPWMVHVC